MHSIGTVHGIVARRTAASRFSRSVARPKADPDYQLSPQRWRQIDRDELAAPPIRSTRGLPVAGKTMQQAERFLAAHPPSSAATQSSRSANRESARKNRSRRGRWLRLVLCAATLAALWLMPVIVASTPLRQRILPILLAEYPGRIVCGSASLSWFSPVTLCDVTFHDLDGEPMLHIRRISSTNTLLDIVADWRRPGHFRIQEPQLRVAVSPDGSNLEHVIGRWADAARENSSPLGFTAEIVDGSIQLADASAERRVVLGSLSAEIKKPFEFTEPLSITSTLCAGEYKQDGTVKLQLGWQCGVDGAWSDGSGNLVVRSTGFSLHMLEPLLGRFVRKAELDGRIDAEVNIELTAAEDSPTWTAHGRAAVAELDFAARDLLGGDRLRIHSLTLSGAVQRAGNCVELEDVSCESEAATFSADGRFRIADSNSRLPAERLAVWLQSEEYRVTGQLDLARLSNMLRGTLRIRDGLRMIKGRIDGAVSSGRNEGRREWSARLAMSDLTARYRGEELTWRRPLRAELLAHQASDGWEVQKLACDSKFLQLSAQGTLDAAKLSARCNLHRIGEEMNRFVDWSGFDIAGTLQADAQTHRGQGDRLELEGDLRLEEFELTMPGRHWREQALQMMFSAEARADGTCIEAVQSARLRLSSGADRLDVEQLEPVELDSPTAEFPFRFRLSGNLARWTTRAAPWLPSDRPYTSGRIEAGGTVRLSKRRIDYQNIQTDIENLGLRAAGLYLDEPRVRIISSGLWNWSTRQFTSPRTTWASNSLSLRADNVAWQRDASDLQTCSGEIVFRGGLDNIVRWLRNPRRPAKHRAFGVASGSLRMEQNGSLTQIVWNLKVDDPLLAHQPPAALTWNDNVRPNLPPQQALNQSAIWQDERLIFLGEARYNSDSRQLNLQRLRIDAAGLGLQLEGQLSNADDSPTVDAAGSLNYDMSKFVDSFREYLGDEIRIQGSGQRRFWLAGPLLAAGSPVPPTDIIAPQASLATGGLAKDASQPVDLDGEFGLGWTSADVYGLQIGAGELNARLAGGRLDFQPLDVRIGEGRLRLSAHIAPSFRDPRLIVDEGPLLSRLRISPELCRQWLKFFAPLVADATHCNGRFSVDLTAAECPLAHPGNADVSGVLTVHGAEVKPGPLAEQFVQIAAQLNRLLGRGASRDWTGDAQPLLTMPEQQVEFRMVDRRVHHRGLEFLVDDVTIRTAGSVGLDDSLEILAEVPIHEDWIDGERHLQTLRGQVLQIPVRGTLARPVVDQSVLGGLARQIGGAAAGSLLRDELNKALQRLFGGD